MGEGHGGRFVFVMPRSRKEDAEFREWVQTHTPAWVRVRDLPHPRRHGGPRDPVPLSPSAAVLGGVARHLGAVGGFHPDSPWGFPF